MSNEQENQEIPPSIFSGAEPPDDDAHITDEAPAEDSSRKVDEEGNLTVSTELEEGDNPFDHSAEQEAIRETERAAGVAPPELPEMSPIPPQNPGMAVNAVDPVRQAVEARFSAEFGELEVEVDQDERDAFVRAAVHDEEMTFFVDLEGLDATVTVVIPPDVFTTMASATARKWGKDGVISGDSDLDWLLAFQQLHVWFQVRAVNGEPTPWAEYWLDGMPKLRELREYMQEYENFEQIQMLKATRWRMILDATRIAELKYKICLQNWKDRSFFTGADTA